MFSSPMHLKVLCGNIYGTLRYSSLCGQYFKNAFYGSSFSFTQRKCNKLNGMYVKSITSGSRIGALRGIGKPEQDNSEAIDILTKAQAQELAFKLTLDERKLLLLALQEFESKRIKDDYEGQLAAHRWRSKFGRPSKVPSLGDVDPTGSYCPVPDDWLKKKYAATVPPPCTRDLLFLAIANSIPFIGFGFLDNFIMIVAGDYIDKLMGAYICISTMAAAALGNTFSDIIGIGSAQYVEKGAEKIGFKPPELSPIQLDMKWSRRMSNLGRVVGITIGCLLGMVPLLFMNEKPTAPKD